MPPAGAVALFRRSGAAALFAGIHSLADPAVGLASPAVQLLSAPHEDGWRDAVAALGAELLATPVPWVTTAGLSRQDPPAVTAADEATRAGALLLRLPALERRAVVTERRQTLGVEPGSFGDAGVRGFLERWVAGEFDVVGAEVGEG